MRIGITIGLHHAAETLWNNGIKQNAVYLSMALRNCPQVEEVLLVNTTAVPVSPALPWDLQQFPTTDWQGAKDRVDVLIELGGQIDAAQTEHLKQRNARLVAYCCGFEYISSMESVLFNRPLWGANLFVNQRYDDIWMVPQVDHISRPYFEVLRRQQARPVPFVWSPVFLEQRTASWPAQGCYQPRGDAPRRISVMEPNINITKFCFYPVLIAELAYRARPQAIDLLQVTNAERIARESLEFITLMNQMDIVRQHKAVFLGRYDTPTFLAERTDIMVSHQLENPLNYFYLDVCWQGYPLVHNASLCADLGFYYEGNEVSLGAQRVLEVIDGFDARHAAYRERQRRLIGRYLPDEPQLVAQYAGLLNVLFERPAR